MNTDDPNNSDQEKLGGQGKLLHEALSRAIIGAAMTVLNELKPKLALNFKHARLEWKRVVREKGRR